MCIFRCDKMLHMKFRMQAMFLPLLMCCLMLVFFVLTGSKSKPKIDAALIGKWKYITGSGGFTGKGPGWDATTGIYFEFKKKGNFKKIENKKTTQCDNFTTEIKATNEVGEKVIKISFKKQLALLASFSADTLFLQEDVADGFSYVFVRMK